MPGKDGTGPLGQGPVAGTGTGTGRRRVAMGTGPVGYCVCSKCGEKAAHTAGIPCASMKCPKCGTAMIRA
jgi:NAD-dependent SIR2 family protein deacetylase